jgi:hypothetical protein
MMNNIKSLSMENVEEMIIIYNDDKGNTELRADIRGETIWATQDQVASLFNVSRPNITWHINNVFKTGELKENSVSKESLLTAKDGKEYITKFYNLDAIIAVGYRINSKKATHFRIWATSVLREYVERRLSSTMPEASESKEVLEGLREVMALLQSAEHKGKLKGKVTLKVTKNLDQK